MYIGYVILEETPEHSTLLRQDIVENDYVMTSGRMLNSKLIALSMAFVYKNDNISTWHGKINLLEILTLYVKTDTSMSV